MSAPPTPAPNAKPDATPRTKAGAKADARTGAFDLTGPLPTRPTVLRASAGTGKTYTIAGLVTRWVAETDLRLPDLLVVTFTRAATAELRDRVRRRLVDAGEYLETPPARRPATNDPVLHVLADADPDTVAERRDKLARALTDVDAATISTIHGFCRHVLDGLGIASDFDRDAELVEDLRELVEEVCDDLLVDSYVEATDRPRIDRKDLVALGKTVVDNPGTRLEPRGSDDEVAAMRLHLAGRIQREVARRARRRRQMSYDDLLTGLDRTLRDPDRGPAAKAALRTRYKAVLIDEFQDTDPVQWSIVSRAFGDDVPDAPPRDAQGDARALVLIGDPKQAIYAFRGADVYAYLDAADEAEDERTLHTSWRADAALLRAFDTFFDGTSFGDDDIAYEHVDHAPGHDAPRFVGAPHDAALRLRLLHRLDSLDTNKSGRIYADQARDLIARDTAADIVELLTAAPRLVERDAQGDETGRDTLQPRHVAVLVRSNAEASLVQDALHTVGVPAVISGVESVFVTPAAAQWQRLLDALERPASVTRVRALALSAWVGWTGDDVAAKTERDWDRLHDDVHRWARLLREHGVATMQRAVMRQRGLRPRLLARDGGERLLADLAHIGELVHTAATAEHLGPAAIAGWLREQVEDARTEQQSEKLRRLETDDEAVQILTVHVSKGLEFPVVYCPFLWTCWIDPGDAPVFHDDDRQRAIDVGGRSHDDFGEHKARAEDELRGEQLRLAYVALTRAKHQVVAHYAPAGVPEWSSLARLLLNRDEGGTLHAGRPAPTVEDEVAEAAARALADRSGGTIAVEHVPATPSGDPWQPPATERAELAAAPFERTLDGEWRRTSYSALTRLDVGYRHVSTEPDEPVKDDEDLTARAGSARRDVGRPGEVGDDPFGLRDVTLPLAAMSGGTTVGTVVHRILEHTDFAADPLESELERTVDDALDIWKIDVASDVLVAGLAQALRTPLGTLLDDTRLCDVPRRDPDGGPVRRMDEVDFELPLDRRRDGRPATVRDLARLFDAHLPAGDPLAAYAGRLPEALLERNLRGYLGGSIDLVLRQDADGGPSNGTGGFWVADYKTNWLAPPGEDLSAWHYRPGALAEAMMHGHYPLQAILYTVAVHRTLRWRLRGYSPATHLKGVLYLFVRGMVPLSGDSVPDEGHPGVFTWRPPAALVEAVSDLLHGSRP